MSQHKSAKQSFSSTNDRLFNVTLARWQRCCDRLSTCFHHFQVPVGACRRFCREMTTKAIIVDDTSSERGAFGMPSMNAKGWFADSTVNTGKISCFQNQRWTTCMRDTWMISWEKSNAHRWNGNWKKWTIYTRTYSLPSKRKWITIFQMRLIHDRETGKLSSTKYFKPTDEGLIMNYHALAPKRYKRSVISGFVYRIYTVHVVSGRISMIAWEKRSAYWRKTSTLPLCMTLQLKRLSIPS